MASSSASHPPTDEGRAHFEDGWCCPKHPDVLLRVRKQGEWRILKETCPYCAVLFNLEVEAKRRDLGLAAGPNAVPHGVDMSAAAPEVPSPAVAAAAVPAPHQVPVAVAGLPARMPHHDPPVKQVTRKSVSDADDNKGIYTGSVLRVTGKPHGSGKMEYSNGDVYDGDWQDGRRHGHGVYAWGPGRFQGDTYDGEYVNSNRHGHGIYRTATGNTLEGQWKDNKCHGRVVSTDGVKYEGVWEDNELVEVTRVNGNRVT